MLKRDLGSAKILYSDDIGRVADFHSLRHTYITMLARKGVHPKFIQSLARHSRISLTMDRYSHIDLIDQRSVLEVLPLFTDCRDDNKENGRAVARKTGTDDLPTTTVPKLFFDIVNFN